jgi:hypothetical protein
MVRTLLDPAAQEYLRLFGFYPERGGGLLGTIVDRGLLATLVRLPLTHPSLFWTTLVLAALLLPYLVLAAAAPFTTSGTARVMVIVLLSVTFYFVFLSGGPHGSNRFRQPVMPIVSILAGCALGSWHRRRARLSPLVWGTQEAWPISR